MQKVGSPFPALSETSRAVLVDLLVHGPQSRADLARRSGLSPASLTRMIRTFADSGAVSESDATTTQDLTSIFAIGDMIMRPFPAAPLSIRVSSVTIDANGVARIDWSQSNNKALTARVKNSVVSDLPPGLIEKGESLILGETEFKYTSPFAQVIKTPINFNRSYYLRPRTVDKVLCSNC